jgi:hypothetical protein
MNQIFQFEPLGDCDTFFKFLGTNIFLDQTTFRGSLFCAGANGSALYHPFQCGLNVRTPLPGVILQSG